MLAELVFALLFGALGFVIYQKLFGGANGSGDDDTQGNKGGAGANKAKNKNKNKNKNQKSQKGKGQQNKNTKGGASRKQNSKKHTDDPLSYKPEIDLNT